MSSDRNSTRDDPMAFANSEGNAIQTTREMFARPDAEHDGAAFAWRDRLAVELDLATDIGQRTIELEDRPVA